MLSNKTSIAEKNALFESMTPAQRRVAIATDALQRVGKDYISTTGEYMRMHTRFNINQYDMENDDLCSVLENCKDECTVCARGALFLSAVLTFDRCKLSSFADQRDSTFTIRLHGRLENLAVHENIYFDHYQIGLIERTFECYTTSTSDAMRDLTEEDEDAARQYGETLGNSHERLVAICQNIIDNRGEFVIPVVFYEKARDGAADVNDGTQETVV